MARGRGGFLKPKGHGIEKPIKIQEPEEFRLEKQKILESFNKKLLEVKAELDMVERRKAAIESEINERFASQKQSLKDENDVLRLREISAKNLLADVQKEQEILRNEREAFEADKRDFDVEKAFSLTSLSEQRKDIAERELIIDKKADEINEKLNRVNSAIAQNRQVKKEIEGTSLRLITEEKYVSEREEIVDEKINKLQEQENIVNFKLNALDEKLERMNDAIDEKKRQTQQVLNAMDSVREAEKKLKEKKDALDVERIQFQEIQAEIAQERIDLDEREEALNKRQEYIDKKEKIYNIIKKTTDHITA